MPQKQQNSSLPTHSAGREQNSNESQESKPPRQWRKELSRWYIKIAKVCRRFFFFFSTVKYKTNEVRCDMSFDAAALAEM